MSALANHGRRARLPGIEFPLGQREWRDPEEVTEVSAQRGRFVIGFGLGAGFTSVAADGVSRESKAAFVSDFKIGYALSTEIAMTITGDSHLYSGRYGWRL